MATFQHPASLNAFQQFGQACSILRNTTRASNPAWYQDALELKFQIHIRTDGSGITTFYHDSKKAKWSNGPSLSEEILQDPAPLDTFVAEILRFSRSHGATSLGVILHVADEFATTELKPELDNPAALSDLRDTAISDPGSILEDSSILADQASWRVLPYPAAGSEVIGTTITISKQHAPLIAKLRETGDAENFPIITHALSAPLVAIMGLSKAVEPTPGKPFVAILQYPWFTALAFFNEHADLRLVRTLQHRGLHRSTNFRNALTTTNASLEFVDPDLFLLPLGENVDATLCADLKITFTTSRVEVVRQIEIEGIPAWCPEPVISAHPRPRQQGRRHAEPRPALDSLWRKIDRPVRVLRILRPDPQDRAGSVIPCDLRRGHRRHRHRLRQSGRRRDPGGGNPQHRFQTLRNPPLRHRRPARLRELDVFNPKALRALDLSTKS